MTSDLVAAMADGIGEYSYLSDEWISAAQEQLNGLADLQSETLADKKFVYCEVAHNAPVFLHAGSKLAMNITIDNGAVTVAAGELPDSECDFKLQGDHSILSNLAHVQYHGRDPEVVAAATHRLGQVSRWETSGQWPSDPALASLWQHSVACSLTQTRACFMRSVIMSAMQRYRRRQ